MFKKTVLVHALTLAFGAAVLSAGVVQTASAQSNATGSIFGTVTPGPNVKVMIENPSTGVRRTLTPDASGRFQATSLPTGTYTVTEMNGTTAVGSVQVDAVLGRGAEAVFVATPVAGNMQTVQVTGIRRTIDVSSTNNGATFNARQLANLPIARNIDAIIQLAPNTTRADSRFAGGASFGGGAASENSYYINGFPVVNPLTGLGASQLPFGAIAEAQVLTGGFGAEFGRSVGGVVNIITKSGTNTWEAGAMAAIEPKGLRSRPKDIYYNRTGAAVNAATDGTVRFNQAENTQERMIYGAYVGGPIIQDKLFMFAAVETNDTKQGYVNGSRISTSNALNGWRHRETDIQRYMGKLDWNITDNHRLEFTTLGDTPKVTSEDSSYNYVTRSAGTTVNSKSVLKNVDNNGGKTNMLRYTGNLTQDLTLTGLYGRTESEHTNDFPIGYDPNVFSSVSTVAARAPGISYPNPQTQTGNILVDGSKDTVKSGRIDLEYRLGDHTLRAGVDQTKIESANAGEYKAGGGTWNYFRAVTATGAPRTTPIPVSGGRVPSPTTLPGPLSSQGYYVARSLFSDVTGSYAEQQAFYLEDKYQVTKNVLVTLGIRDESFKNQNENKVTFLDMKNQINPRLAAAWDVYGDASLKVYGTAGRYSVPIPTHITVRGAGRSTYTDQYYTYTGVDANGAPTGLQQLTVPFSGNNEFGQEKNVATLSALDLKPSYQDEITLGFEKAYSASLNFGVKGTYRKLKSTIDDYCDTRAFERYAETNNIAITNTAFGSACQTFNPGENNSFLVPYSNDGKLTRVDFSAADLGFDKPKRTYAALDFFAEHPFRNGWYAKANYTLSRNKGNTEGQVKSDNGQADVSATSTWDYPELMVGADGLLPNDRKHQFKVYGFYEVSKEVMVGGNFLAASGRPRSCIGTSPLNDGSPGYTNAAFYCGGTTVDQNVLTPRGTLGRLPSDIRLDANVAYKPDFVKGLQLRLDVFNVFNKQTVQNVTEAYNSSTNVSSLYGTPLSYTAPRSMRFTVTYDKKFN
jgi:hypothetical protein